MKPDYGRCELCKKGILEFKEKKEVASTEYTIIKCNKCNHEVAKRAG